MYLKRLIIIHLFNEKNNSPVNNKKARFKIETGFSFYIMDDPLSVDV